MSEYEEVRRDFCGYGYNAPLMRNHDDLKNGVFKQAVAAAKFLREFGFPAGVNSSHWKGFIVHVFEQLSPSIPQPGHLCNKKALAEYVSGRFFSNVSKPERDRESLRAIYMKALLPQFRTQSTMSTLGVD